MTRPKILWLTRYGSAGASTRYRVLQYLDHPALDSFDHHVLPLAEFGSGTGTQARGIARRLWSFGARSFDAVVVQKEPVMPRSLWRLLALQRQRPTPIAWDVDDAVWIGGRQAFAAARWMAKRSTIGVAGNSLIASWMEEHGAGQTTVVPTTFQPPSAVDQNPGDGDNVRLVWIGSPATSTLLDQYVEILAEMIKRSPSLSIELVGSGVCATAALPNVLVTQWSVENERRALSKADYGLALQRPSPYNDHKCGFKLVQYLAYGVVPIASPGVVHQSIVGGAGILLSASDQEATDEIAQTVRTAPTSTQRELAQHRWREQFTVDSGAERWAEIFRTIIVGSD